MKPLLLQLPKCASNPATHADSPGLLAWNARVAGLAGMWTTMDSAGHFGGETFSLRLHPLQDEVPPQQLLRVWTHRLMDAVSEVGETRWRIRSKFMESYHISTVKVPAVMERYNSAQWTDLSMRPESVP